MQSEILYIKHEDASSLTVKSTLNFTPFLEFIMLKMLGGNLSKNGYLSYVLDEFIKHPELQENLKVEKASLFADQLQLIYNVLCPITEDEETHFWALSLPVTPTLFYGTNGFYKLAASRHSSSVINSDRLLVEKNVQANQLKLCYSVILDKCYKLPQFFNQNWVESFPDTQTGAPRMYELHMDTRFIQVASKQNLPKINLKALRARIGSNHKQLLPLLERILPLENFTFNGFGLVDGADITAKYALEEIRTAILQFVTFEDETCFKVIEGALKALVNNQQISFGIIPLITINNNVVFQHNICSNSRLLEITGKEGLEKATFLALSKAYLEKPRQIIFPQITPPDEVQYEHLRLLKKEGIESHALLPVYFNRKLTGVLEVYSEIPGSINENVLIGLDSAMPLLAQLLNSGIHLFEEELEQVIQEKFTSLQPSVQWKFNEVAWNYIQDKNQFGAKSEIGDIRFENVFPLYGAIDIRNSTINRNASLYSDLVTQFGILISVLQELQECSGFGLIEEKIFLSRQWLKLINGDEAFTRGIELDAFLEENIFSFLADFKSGNPQYAHITDRYLEAIDLETGEAGKQRRLLEESMSSIIDAINFYLEEMKEKIQAAYPCYFEKFRTDGIEYDIYIGQSIAPDKPFSDMYLKNLRLWQLSTMAGIAKYTHSLKTSLPIRVETTQLIFIHSNSIEIRFRRDEKRFDVEGAYNIRYQIVKKRIDKAFVKNTSERLTQPGKIAIVYFNQHESAEYRGYIQFLQQQGVLQADLEDLELAEMQGVNGLRALRVGVKLG